MSTVQLGTSPIAVVSKGDGPGTVYNRDPVNAVFWGVNASQANRADASILDPQTGITVDGTQDVYCCVASGTAEVDFVQGGYTRVQGPQVNATLLDLPNPVILPAGSSTSNLLIQADVHTYSSLDISLSAYCPLQATTGAALVGNLILTWYDDAAGGNPVYVENWYVYISNAANAIRATGSVPMRGYYCTVQFQTSSTEPVTLQFATIHGAFRTPVYSTFRQPVPSINFGAGITVTSVNPNANLQGYTNNLGTIANLTPGAGLRAYPLPLYAGPVSVAFQVGTAGLNNDATLVDLSQVTSGNLVAGLAQDGVIWAGTNTPANYQQQALIFPRAPVVLVANPATTSQIFFGAVAQQGY